MSDQIERDRVEPVSYTSIFEGVAILCQGPASARIFSVYGQAFQSMSAAQAYIRTLGNR